jgi:hypothetical protein
MKKQDLNRIKELSGIKEGVAGELAGLAGDVTGSGKPQKAVAGVASAFDYLMHDKEPEFMSKALDTKGPQEIDATQQQQQKIFQSPGYQEYLKKIKSTNDLPGQNRILNDLSAKVVVAEKKLTPARKIELQNIKNQVTQSKKGLTKNPNAQAIQQHNLSFLQYAALLGVLTPAPKTPAPAVKGQQPAPQPTAKQPTAQAKPVQGKK